MDFTASMNQPFDTFTYAHQHFQEIAWMSQNTNHLFPPYIVKKAITEALREKRYQEYPFGPGLPELKELLIQDFGLTDVKVGITAGGTEALYMMMRALMGAGDEVISTDPSYLIIHKFIELSGAKTVNLDLYQPPWRMTPDKVQEAIGPHTKMILLIDPLNPLGSGYPKEDVKAIAEIAHDKKLLLLNDVTYRDFSDSHTLTHTIAPEQSITVWSLSKNCGLAGLRLGGFMARPELFDKIWKYNTNDLGVNVLAQFAGVAALKAKPRVFPRIKRQSRKNQKRIKQVVDTVEGTFLPVFPSQANMFVIDISKLGLDPGKLQQEMLVNHAVFVRSGSYLSPKFGKNFVRLSFSNHPEDIEKFAVAFPKAVAAVKSG
jgi:aspartate/methionine/tyrosine aminotransferase